MKLQLYYFRIYKHINSIGNQRIFTPKFRLYKIKYKNLKLQYLMQNNKLPLQKSKQKQKDPKKQATLIIKQTKKPIQIIKQLSLKNHQDIKKSFFILCTIDRKIFLITVNHAENLEFIYQCSDSWVLATSAYFQDSSNELYLGGLDGCICKMNVKVNINILGVGGDDKKNCLQKDNWEYRQQQISENNEIILLYTRKSQIITWNLSNTITIISKQTKQKHTKLKLTQNITYGISFRNPYKFQNVGCVSFDNGFPPIVFDSDDLAKFGQIIKCMEDMFQREGIRENEVIGMADDFYMEEDEFFVVCGCRSSEKQSSISVYSIQYNKQLSLTYLELNYKFKLHKQILHISLRSGIAVVTMFNTILFFNIMSRSKEMIIEKQDLKTTFGFVLDKTAANIRFIANKGFNFWNSDMYKQGKEIKLRIRQKKRSQAGLR